LSSDDDNKIDAPALMEACEAQAEWEHFEEKYWKAPQDPVTSDRYRSLFHGARERATDKALQANPEFRAEGRALQAEYDKAQGVQELLRVGNKGVDLMEKARDWLKTRCHPGVS
jgi:hypothetical protein